MRSNYFPICNKALIKWRMEQLETNPTALAKNSNGRIAQMTIVHAADGLNITGLSIRILADELGLHPKSLLDDTLKTPKQFRRAVVTKGNGAAKR